MYGPDFHRLLPFGRTPWMGELRFLLLAPNHEHAQRGSPLVTRALGAKVVLQPDREFRPFDIPIADITFRA
jgi:hypothetical protein